ncbi:MAG: Gx transporter family protein [Oscillospiraceae bacterium]
MSMTTKRLTRLALLTAVALVLGYVESFIPIAPGIPGVKLGLSNTVLLYALYLMDTKSAVFLMFLKVVLSGLLYAGFSAMLFSLGGGIFSIIMMLIVRALWREKISIIGVSVVGAVFHNVGQLAVAAFMVNTISLLTYLPVLLISAVVTGILTGLIAKYVIKALDTLGISEKKPASAKKEEDSKK